VLITDLSMQSVNASLAADLRTNILWSAVAILATILFVNALMSSSFRDGFGVTMQDGSRASMASVTPWKSETPGGRNYDRLWTPL
ncbi:MAG: hypothetical protein M1570_00845, partial [Chloroflexi bacterium]|nr:hypothetical protein [Chloroflexota bacterium]